MLKTNGGTASQLAAAGQAWDTWLGSAGMSVKQSLSTRPGAGVQGWVDLPGKELFEVSLEQGISCCMPQQLLQTTMQVSWLLLHFVVAAGFACLTGSDLLHGPAGMHEQPLRPPDAASTQCLCIFTLTPFV